MWHVVWELCHYLGYANSIKNVNHEAQKSNFHHSINKLIIDSD